jgi:hypothetical protein
MLKSLEILGRSGKELWKIYSKEWFDLYQYLGNDYRSLNRWLSKAGIKRAHPEITGKDIPGFYARKEYEKIEAHNIDDLNTSEELFQFPQGSQP